MLTKTINRRTLYKVHNKNNLNSKNKAFINNKTFINKAFIFNKNKNKDKCLISKEDCYLVNQVVSFEDPYDKMDQFMVDETFYEPMF